MGMMLSKPNWDLAFDQLKFIVDIIRQREKSYSTIRLIGGEPSLWNDFTEKCRFILRSGICKNLSMSTNSLEFVKQMPVDVLQEFSHIEVSIKHALPAEKLFDNVVVHGTKHKPLPTHCVEPDINKVQCGCNYITIFDDIVYRCGNAASLCAVFKDEYPTWILENSIPLIYPTSLDVFDSVNHQACGYCLANKYVWDKI